MFGNKEQLPLMMSAKDLQALGLSRGIAYALFNRKDFPVIVIGGRKFVEKGRFFAWLDAQAQGTQVGA